MAALMASAYAKRSACVLRLRGPARRTSSPGSTTRGSTIYRVLAIAGQRAPATLGGHYQQELDLTSMRSTSSAMPRVDGFDSENREIASFQKQRFRIGERRLERAWRMGK